jgi:hypothetical protein
MDKQQRTEKIELYGKGYDLLEAALRDIPREAWTFKPGPDDWSVHEIVVHMGDSESMAALRCRKLVAEPGSTLMGYQEADWPRKLDYFAQDPQLSLQIIRSARLSTYNLLKSLPDEVFEHTVKHEEYSDPYTFDQWLEIYAKHIPDHIEQLNRSVQAWKESG